MKINVNINRIIFLFGDAVRAVVFCLALVPSAYAGGDIFLQCAQQYPDEDAERLKCYDQLVAPASAQSPAPGQNVDPDVRDEASAAPAAVLTRGTERSYLTRAWNLDNLSNPDISKLGRIQPYRQTYLLAKRSSKPNHLPSSPAIGHSTLAPNDIDAVETKFQFSFKADIGNQHNIDFFGITSLRFWGAYTQQSHWQVINFRNSSAFRETIYEPELIATLGTGYASGLKLINVGLLHQSNGRLLPESRSWNRVYMLAGMEWNDMTSIMVRGWWRIPENPLRDDNPDIGDYYGRSDLVIRWEPRDKTQAIAMLVRNNLRRTKNRGYVQIDWATPVKLGNAARVHIQMTSGYGESFIDYNYRQNTIGLGLSFREW